MLNCRVRSFLEQEGGGSFNGLFLSSSTVCFTPVKSTRDLDDLPFPGSDKCCMCVVISVSLYNRLRRAGHLPKVTQLMSGLEPIKARSVLLSTHHPVTAKKKKICMASPGPAQLLCKTFTWYSPHKAVFRKKAGNRASQCWWFQIKIRAS